ncbi:MAG: sulfotransferase domain-containing protein [Cyanobacteriota bacterium]|nr:sulfotransferase domain-containing protein [Cyanobacteriota bacterium]
MKKIIVVGYPKSGNTWITRLVAELVSCPVVGFWNSDRDEMAREGFHRKSEFECFKSHHQLSELEGQSDLNCSRIIYVVRDPRDIAISSAYYFQFERYPQLREFFQQFPKGLGFYNRILKKIPCSERYRIARAIQIVLYGSAEINYFCRIPWKVHCKPYLERGCFFVKYENMLVNAEDECKRILNYLGLHRQDWEIAGAIEKQSFKRKKAEFLKQGDLDKAKFLRAGETGQWERKLSREQKQLFVRELSEEFVQLAYSRDPI